ncbi:hypothetical protein [Dolosigranulum pigrum]|uniref:hypothetical protein n=1 Tax=Dolosigranulum pigrum TaxID=29394 RepID=UPI001AD8741B|nr:hypothetical protein [Dolosigranulum pigrum]QTJ35327.1 hypothetical protein FE322_08495 [Dolosigranulum pigrum]QTJ40496.1 hypothetical protein FE325_08445 [Dolosigranulum pigrum]QTJ48979.1 hypothetical protein FE330_08485 [Dolosigranulum pigrum]QTJ54106.1 hypothetical protein FE333_08545 [Dolosigranulum pigrum]
MQVSFDIKKNIKKLILRWKYAYDSFYISLLLWGVLAIDGIIFLVTGNDPISSMLSNNLYVKSVYLFVMATFGKSIKFNIWSNNAYERKDKAIHSELFGLCLIGLYFLFVMLGAEIIWVYPWVDIAVLTIGFILTLRLIRFDFRSDTSEIDI